MFRPLLLLLLVAWSARGIAFCDDCDACCAVDNATTFTGRIGFQTTAPRTSLDGSYTVAYDGAVYRHVIQYVKEDGSGRLLKNFRISPSGGAIDCSKSHVYWRAQEADFAFAAGAFAKLALARSTRGDFCEVEADGRLTRAMLADPSEVYFAFDGLVPEGSDFFIFRNDDRWIEPIDDTLAYQFMLADVQTTTVDNDGGEYYMQATLRVRDIEPELAAAGGCDGVTDAVKSAYFGKADDPACAVDFVSASGDAASAEGATYVVRLGQDLYEQCAETITASPGVLEYATTLRFPTMTDDGTARCYYFQPGAAEQPLTITVRAASDAGVELAQSQFTAALHSITPKRCEPLSDYVIPQAIMRVVVNTTHAITSGHSVSRVASSVPYIGSSTFQLVPDTEDGQSAATCETVDIGDGRLRRRCQYFFRTTKCEKIYSTRSNMCGFEHNTSRDISNLVFEETQGALKVTRRAPPIATELQAVEFLPQLCAPLVDIPIVDATDTFGAVATLRNYQPGVSVDWDAPVAEISFSDPLIVRLEVGDSAALELGDVKLFIKSVSVRLTNPNTGVLITQYMFDVTEKRNLMNDDFLPFYQDPTFCSFYSSSGGGGDPDDKCQPFFDPYGDGLTRWNPFMEALGREEVDAACQAGDSRRRADYFVFDPRRWFRDNLNDFMRVNVQASGVLHQCGGPGDASDRRDTGRRRMMDDSAPRRALMDATETIIFVTRDSIFFAGTIPANHSIRVIREPVEEVPEAAEAEGEEESSSAAAVSLIALMFVLFAFMVMFMVSQSHGVLAAGRQTKQVQSASIEGNMYVPDKTFSHY